MYVVTSTLLTWTCLISRKLNYISSEFPKVTIRRVLPKNGSPNSTHEGVDVFVKNFTNNASIHRSPHPEVPESHTKDLEVNHQVRNRTAKSEIENLKHYDLGI